MLRIKVGDPIPWEKVAILKNGELIKDCIEVDVLNCRAWRIWRDDRGQMVHDESTDEVKTYKDYGHFQIVWMDEYLESQKKTTDD